MRVETNRSGVRFSRAKANPSHKTFTIKPIAELLERCVGDGKGWADPFAGDSTLAEHRNDINPKSAAPSHQLAEVWAKTLPGGLVGVLFDPPYSYRQVSEHYRAAGRRAKSEDTTNYFYSRVRIALVPKVKLGGLAICFGWNSSGFGENNGFELVEVLLVNHGSHHNDTIVVVERKVKEVEMLTPEEENHTTLAQWA